MDEDLVIIQRPDGDQQLKRAAWGRVLEAWRHSGLRASAFARQHHLGAKAFFRWRDKLLPRHQAPPRPGFVELAVAAPAGAPGSADAPLELHLGQARVLVREGCSAPLLRMLVGVIGEGTC